jgi:hypothetical protein
MNRRGSLFLRAFFIALALLHMPHAYAQEDNDVYDPFVDYSEFDESSEEEADINFFRNGRFFTLGFLGGARTFTQELGRMNSTAPTFGLFLSYFFDLRFALQLAFMMGSHDLAFNSGTDHVRGSNSITDVGLQLKYYLNTQNVTRGLAQFNPYFVGGMSQVTRTTTVSGQTAFGKESAVGFDAGAGIEIPMMRNRMYFGLQATYKLINFPDEGREIILDGNKHTGIFPRGDMASVVAVLGVNF